MTAHRAGLAVALALATQGCATGGGRRHALPPPARESRAGVPERSAGPASALLPRRTPAAPEPEAALERALTAVSGLVGRQEIVLDGVDYGPGCAALVRAAFAQRGRPLPAEARDVAAVYAIAGERGDLTTDRRPAPGDLVFLADAPGGPPAHVGVVARTEPDGTAFVLHRAARGVLRVRLNLAYPERPVDPATGKHINDTLIVRARPVPAGSLVIALSDLLRRS